MKIPFCKWGLIMIVLLFIVILAGCTETPITTQPEGSSSSEIMEDQQYPISFQEGLSRAEEVLRDEDFGPPPPIHVYFAQAKRIDSEGKAEQWIFGIQENDENTFIVVQSNRQTLAPYPSDLPEKDITSPSIIDPATLIGRNRQLFMNAGAREPLILPELELSEGFYTVTVSTGSGNAVMLFDASTGNPVK
jgi:hypothetical protein